MDATQGLAAILRDARKSALLRMRLETYSQTALIVVDQHPGDGGETDDHGGRDRPDADAGVADGLPFGFIPGDFAIARLVVFVRLAHRLPPASSPTNLGSGRR